MHGTIYEERAGRLVRIVDRGGAVHAELTWRNSPIHSELVRLAVDGAAVDGAVISHALLGAAHAVGDTAMTALDWARPAEIPAIAEPGRLPLGAGAAILNAIAILAQRAGVTSLCYAGPYPTAALWRTLVRSFRTSSDEAAFTADALSRALRVARDPIAVEFAPAPHARIAISGGFVELRDGIERAVIAGLVYEPGGSPARLVRADESVDPGGDPAERGAVHCEIWFGDARYARVASLSPGGAVQAGPWPIPRCDSPVLGREFPAALRIAIAELVGEAVVAPLAAAARELCAVQTLRWADLGGRAAAQQPDGFAVHAALWDRIAPLGLGRLALALAEALAPVVARAIACSAEPS
jgi:hypothetical protein